MSENTNHKNQGSSNPLSVTDTNAEDLDWLELDEDEAFEDDEFGDDPDSKQAAQAPSTVRAQPKTREAGVKKKKSSSKLKWLLLVTAAAGGGYFYYGTLSNSLTKTDQTLPVVSLGSDGKASNFPSQEDLNALRDAPPLPAPTDEKAAQQAKTDPQQLPLGNDINTAEQPPQSNDGVLTPLPNLDAVAQVELTPLEGAEQPVNSAAEQKNEPIDSALTPLAEGSLPPTPAPIVQADPLAPPFPPVENAKPALVPSDNNTLMPPLQDAVAPTLSEKDLIAQTEKLPEQQDATAQMDIFAETPPLQETQDPLAIPDDETASEKEEIPFKVATEITQPLPEPVATPEKQPAEPPKATEVDVSPKTETAIPVVEPVVAAPPAETAKKDDLPKKPEESKPVELKTTPPAVPPVQEPVKAPETTKVEVKKVVKKAEVVKKSEKKPSESPKKPVISWKLRSAQPGMAVIFDPSTGNMQSIEVGDRITGVGRIKSIARENGRWVVRGTSGSISQ